MTLKEEQVVSLQNLDTDTTLAIAYEAFKKLEWPVLFAGPDKLLANTIKKWNIHPQQIIVGAAGNALHISSEMVRGENFDMAGKNKKNVLDFITAFREIENTIDKQVLDANRQTINELREKTQQVAEEQQKESKEAERVMKLSQKNLTVTYSIIAINALIFIAMIATGISISQPTAIDLIPWGANYGPFTLSGEWWRLITNTFLHFGILHIGFNMYALYTVGMYLEPMLGKIRYTVAYLCTGVLASLGSLWWHLSNPVTSAGASGAIFGMYGVFLALLSTNLIPPKIRKGLLQSIGVFVVYNLGFGLSPGIDNAGHVSGLLSGLLVGYVYYFTLKKEFSTTKILLISALMIATTVGGTYLFLQKMKKPDTTEVEQLKNELQDARYPDAEKYDRSLAIFFDLEKEALKPYKDTLPNAEKLEAMRVFSRPKWVQSSNLLQNMSKFNVSDRMKKKAAFFKKYTDSRIEEIDLLQEVNEGKADGTKKLNDVQKQMQAFIDSIKTL